MTELIALLLGILGIIAYIVILITIIVDMCNPNPYLTNWEYIKECFKK